MVDINDSVKVVQVQLPDDLKFKDKQLGFVYGTYVQTEMMQFKKDMDAVILLKAIIIISLLVIMKVGWNIKGDLLYAFMEKTDIFYGLVPRIAAHFIRLQTVYANRYMIVSMFFKMDRRRWRKHLIDSLRYRYTVYRTILPWKTTLHGSRNKER